MRAGRRLSSATAGGTLLGSPPPSAARRPPLTGASGGISGSFIGAGALGLSDAVCREDSVEDEDEELCASELPLWACEDCISLSEDFSEAAAAPARRCSSCALSRACLSAWMTTGLGRGYSAINFAVDMRSVGYSCSRASRALSSMELGLSCWSIHLAKPICLTRSMSPGRGP